MSLSMDEAPPLLAPLQARALGPERSQVVTALRERLHAAGLRWPEWLEARPGLVSCVIGDCDDALLPGVREHLGLTQPRLLLDGLSALALAVSAPRMALLTSSPSVAAALRGALPTQQKGPPSVAVLLRPPCFPTQPEQAVADAGAGAGRPFVVPAEELLRAGAAVLGQPAPLPCAVVGAVKTPLVVDLATLPEAERTPRALLARAGGAESPGWVALTGEPLPDAMPEADAPLPLPTGTAALTLTILPAAHPLVRRYRASALPRVRTACLSCRACTDACPEAPRLVAPHQVMAALARRRPKPARLVPLAAGCTGCGACTVACPAELLPSRVLLGLKGEAEEPADPYEDPSPADDRRLPRGLALSRLGLAAYRHTLGASAGSS